MLVFGDYRTHRHHSTKTPIVNFCEVGGGGGHDVLIERGGVNSWFLCTFEENELGLRF